MTDQPCVLGVCGSPRARFKDTARAIELIKQTESYQDLYSGIYELASNKKISNSEALMWMALFGAAREGAEVDILLLKDALKRSSGRRPGTLPREAREKVDRAHGLVLASPVYFGDCSSWMTFFLNEVSLRGKVAGVVSVGAKRNGGQETNNIFTLMTAFSHGAAIVGNGPPTSQYGGTGWAGDVGAILDDNFGLATSLGTGKRVVEVTRQIITHRDTPATFLLLSHCMDHSPDALHEEIERAFGGLSGVTFRSLNLNDYTIGPCRACSMCPNPKKGPDGYGCIIDDDMRRIDAEISRCDALGFMIDDTPENPSFWPRFKVFVERTRHLRRDHFQLADLPVFFFVKKDLTRGNLLDVKTVTYMLRQNAVLFGPLIESFFAEGRLIHQSVPIPDACQTMAEEAQKRRYTVESSGVNDYAYRPVGYNGEVLI